MYSNQAIYEALINGGLYSEKVLEMLKANLREESAAKIGNKKGYKIVESMIKKADTDVQPNFGKAHPYGDRFAFLDGHRIFVSDTDLGYEISEKPYRVENMFPVVELTPITIDYEELNYFIKLWAKMKKPYIFKVGEKVIGVNPRYLKDVIDYSGSTTILVCAENTGRSPIYAEDKSCMTLPVNIKDVNYEEWYKNHIELKEVA